MSDQITVITLSGELEIGRKQEISAALHVEGSEPGMLIDCSGMTYADSTSIAALLRFHDEAGRHKIPVALIIVGRQFARLIAYAGLGDAFTIFDNRAEALMYLMNAGTT